MLFVATMPPKIYEPAIIKYIFLTNNVQYDSCHIINNNSKMALQGKRIA